MPVGGFLEVLPLGPKELLGSGHPNEKGQLPELLGVMRSNDGGLTWAVIARLGEADLHRMVLKFGRLYAFDAVLGAVLVSSDGGRTFQQHIAPPEPMVELEIDPGDAGRMLLASEQTTFRSVDGGDTWRPVGRLPGEPARLKALDAGHLYVALKTGAILKSRDGAKSWRPVYQP